MNVAAEPETEIAPPKPDGWPELPEAALYGLAGEIVRAIEPHSEADPAAILLQALVAAGNIAGPGPHCRVEATRHALNLFVVLVGETSRGRKGTSWNHIKRLFAGVDQIWANERIASGLSSAEGLITEVRDDPEHPIDRRLLVMQPEFASVLRVMTREGNTLSALVRDAWDEGDLRTLVKHNPLRATSALISMICHVTRIELIRSMSDSEYHNGFANRFLWCCVRRSKFLPRGGHVPESEINRLTSSLQDVAGWAKNNQNVQFTRDDAAERLWDAAYRKLGEELPGLLGAVAARAEAQVLRLSAIYALLDRSSIVRVRHLQAALAVWDYCFASARYIFGDRTGDWVADRIREALREAGDAGLTRTQIRDLFRRHAPGERVSEAFSQLAALGLASRKLVPTEGRPLEFWLATKAT